MRQLINKEIEKTMADHDLSRRGLYLYFLLAVRLFGLGRNYLATRFYLRRANRLNGLVFTNRRPDIENKGYLEIGHLVRIWSNVNRCRLSVKKGGRLIIGNNCRLNGPIIAVTSEVRIGNNCRIAPQVYIMDGDFHALDDRLAEGASHPIIIEDDAWIATRSMVLKGVRIGKGAIVAAGAVVTKDVAPYTVVAGVPAKVVKRIQPPGQEEPTVVREALEPVV